MSEYFATRPVACKSAGFFCVCGLPQCLVGNRRQGWAGPGQGRLGASAMCCAGCHGKTHANGIWGLEKWEAPWFVRALRAGGGKGERRCGSTDACAAVAAWGKERRILAAGPLPLLMGKHTGGGVSIALGFIGNVE